MLDGMLDRANSVCLLALSCSDRCVLALCYVYGLTALCCAMLCLGSKESKLIQEGSPTNKLSSAITGCKKGALRSIKVGEIYVSL